MNTRNYPTPESLIRNRVLIATPVDGHPDTATVTHGYHQAVRALEREGAVQLSMGLSWQDDLARARSRIVRIALERDGWDWILWWDDDVVPRDVGIVAKMISIAERGGHEMVACPYPRKRIPTSFPFKPLASDLQKGTLSVRDDLLEVEWVGFGFVLTSRKMLEEMSKDYFAEEWFTDDHDGKYTVALFRQVMTRRIIGSSQVPGTRQLLSEDYSFCYRYREMGGHIQMYVGEGSVCAHIGQTAYKGEVDDIGNL